MWGPWARTHFDAFDALFRARGRATGGEQSPAIPAAAPGGVS